MQKKRVDRCLFVGLSVVLAAASARAAPSCHINSATAVSFGNYNVYGSATTVIPGTVSYGCPPPTPGVTVTFDTGLHPTSGKRAMQLTGGADLLLYDIYKDAGCLTPWSPSVPTPEPDGNNLTISFYACLGGGQDVSVGNYSDTITVTFNF
jgi:spore coat protein U-like protein